MPDTAADLARRGKQLPREERERLVDALLESLNEPASSGLALLSQISVDNL